MIEYIANILNDIFNVKNFEEKAFNTSSLPYVKLKVFFIDSVRFANGTTDIWLIGYTGCLSQLDYYSNYKTHRAFKNVFSLVLFTLKKLFCMFAMFSS